MKRSALVPSALLLLSLFAGSSLADAKIGEFHIPGVHPLDSAALVRLRRIIQEDSSARALADEVEAKARPLLDATPHPLQIIHYEGLVNTDPRRIATVKKLGEMGDIARLVRYWQISGDTAAEQTLKGFLLPWATTYKPTGNDVNENKFYPMLVAYFYFREDLPQAQRDTIDAWLEKMGTLHEKAVRTSTHFTNRYSKHLRLLTIMGRILDRPEWVAAAYKGIKRFVSNSLRADGTSYDLEQRDALSYHKSSLRPVIELAMLAGEEGRELYSWTSPNGGSIKKSVHYMVPYAMGEKQHREWVNSKIDLDKKRAAAGLDYYKPGRLFEPRSALRLMSAASYFDKELLSVVRHLTGDDRGRFPTWRVLVNEAAREPEGE